jgi:hypothetical protein
MQRVTADHRGYKSFAHQALQRRLFPSSTVALLPDIAKVNGEDHFSFSSTLILKNQEYPWMNPAA